MPFDLDAYHRYRTSHSLGAIVAARELTTSTMDDARAGAAAGGLPGTVYLADAQTAGRGRLGRPWASAGEGLYVTYHLAVRESPTVPLYAVVAALAVSDAIRETAHLATNLKWPNDVLYQGRKLAGILAEAVHHERVDVFLGIGVNLRAGAIPPELAATATSVESEAAATTPSREELLAALSSALERHVSQLARSPAVVIEQWRSRLVTIGQRVRLTAASRTPGTPGEVHEGEAVDVSPRGELIVRLADGTLASYAAGDVTTA